jgi:hypothetical protein
MDQKGEYVPPSTYSNINTSPLMHNNIPGVSNNQSSPSQSDIANLQSALKSESNFVTCPFCKNQAVTRTERSCSIANILCCACFVVVPWLIFQCCRGKDLNCYDADHFCNRCGNNLAHYHAC